MRCTVYIAASVDGYIARTDGDLSWLGEPTAETLAEFDRLMESVDGVVLGRNTFDAVASFGEWPYSKPVLVLTNRPLATPASLDDRVEADSGPVRRVVERLAERGWRHAYVDGGRTIQAFLAAGLVQRLIVTSVPVLLGRGIPLFGERDEETSLQLVRSRTLEGGLVQSEYRMV